MTTDFVTDVKAYAAAGFLAMEIWLDKVFDYLKDHDLAEAKHLMACHGMKVAAACCHTGLLFSEGKKREDQGIEFIRKLKICQALECPVLIIVPDVPEEITSNAYDIAAERLHEAGQIAASYGVHLALEFIQKTPFVSCLDTAIRLVRKADHPNVGVLLDIFHLCVGTSKLIDIERLQAGELKFVHLSDAHDLPRELLQDRHRVWLGEGIFPLERILSMIEATGYEGYASLELFDQAVWAMDPFEAARRAYDNLISALEGGAR